MEQNYTPAIIWGIGIIFLWMFPIVVKLFGWRMFGWQLEEHHLEDRSDTIKLWYIASVLWFAILPLLIIILFIPMLLSYGWKKIQGDKKLNKIF